MLKNSNGYNLNGITMAKVDGQDVPVLVANLNDGQRNVIVSEKVFGNLLALLPKARLQDVKDQLISSVYKAKNMEEYLQIIKDELEFHSNVNAARKYYNMEEREVVYESEGIPV